jgi:hypothetical protein
MIVGEMKLRNEILNLVGEESSLSIIPHIRPDNTAKFSLFSISGGWSYCSIYFLVEPESYCRELGPWTGSWRESRK